MVPGGGAHSLAREGVGESQYTVVLRIYMYFVLKRFRKKERNVKMLVLLAG
jgi:hypothetical protein